MMGSGAETFTQLRGIFKSVKDGSAMGSRVRVVIHSRDSYKKNGAATTIDGDGRCTLLSVCQFCRLTVIHGAINYKAKFKLLNNMHAMIIAQPIHMVLLLLRKNY